MASSVSIVEAHVEESAGPWWLMSKQQTVRVQLEDNMHAVLKLCAHCLLLVHGHSVKPRLITVRSSDTVPQVSTLAAL